MAAAAAASPKKGPRVVAVAVDRSQQSEQAFDWYMETIHRPDDQIVLIHVPEGPTLKLAVNQGLSLSEIQKIIDKEKSENEEMTSKFNGKLQQLGLTNATYRVAYDNNPGAGIVDTAKLSHASMIIMGTRGMGKLRRTVLGSVSDYVVHHASMPVVIFRQ